MVKSKLVRIDLDFATNLENMRSIMEKELNIKVTTPQTTKILNCAFNGSKITIKVPVKKKGILDQEAVIHL